MKIKTPYNAGELRTPEGFTEPVMICGHIWWPVEQRNAYHVLKVHPNGEPFGEPIYEWDTTDGQWPVFTPQEAA
jgi:hypothetical protein